MKLTGQEYAAEQQSSSNQFSAGFKVQIKQAPPCPFCNKEFPLNYSPPVPSSNQEEIKKPGYTYREAESIIEDSKIEPHSYKNGVEEQSQLNNYYYQQAAQDYSQNQAYYDPSAQNQEAEIQEVIHKSSEELGKEVCPLIQ